MIVSRKNENRIWYNLKSYRSRLSGPSYGSSYLVNRSWHRLYGRSIGSYWDINDKSFEEFKEA